MNEKAINLVSELSKLLNSYNADLTYTNLDDGVHIKIGGKTVARREFEQWVIEDE